MRALLVIAIAACQGPPPAAPAPHPPSPSSQAAVAALQAGWFAEAKAQATAALAADPHDSRAAAVHAIASYENAGSVLLGTLGRLHFKELDDERGRARWRNAGDQLDAIDRDLAVVAADPSFSLELCLACWEYDWNHNGEIDDRDRALFEIEDNGKGANFEPGDPRRRPTFRFDVGDAEWARAMIAFQRAFVDLVLAYRWSELDDFNIFSRKRVTLHLVDPGRIRHARDRVLAGIAHARTCRDEYLAETDDDREWVPNPKQTNHPIPFPVDAELYATWAGVLGDGERLLQSQEGISIRELGELFGEHDAPDAFIDVGKLFTEPSDIMLDGSTENVEQILRGLLGHGFATKMRASPLVGRLRHMKQDLERGGDTFDRKLRYLLWLN